MYKQNTCNYGTAILLSIIIGIGTAVLFSQGLILEIVTGLWIAFGISIATLLIFTVLLSLFSCNSFLCFKKAIKFSGKNIIIGSVGTVVTTLSALSVTLITSVTASVILVFFVAFFLTFMLVSLIQLLFFQICHETCCH